MSVPLFSRFSPVPYIPVPHNYPRFWIFHHLQLFEDTRDNESKHFQQVEKLKTSIFLQEQLKNVPRGLRIDISLTP